LECVPKYLKRSKMAFYCYMVECQDGSYYTGWSVDPAKREKQHNRGTGAKYTRLHRPVHLVYVEELPDRSAAMKRERAIKQLNHNQKSKLILKSNVNEAVS
jgi:putative endonuclease